MSAPPIETYGSPLSEVVSKQFYNRSKINLKTLGREENGETLVFSRSPTFLKKHLFNSAWINIISSVNIVGSQVQDSNKGPNLAKKLILSGGSLVWTEGALVKRSGVDFQKPEVGSYGFKAAYNTNTQTGVRPMPGITSFRIVSKNLNGTLREATVEFVVWSLPELEDIEKLFLRPGYHVIVEWGHTYGLDKEGNATSYPIGVTQNYEKFFVLNSADKVYDLIEETRKVNDGNYDGFLGIIKNFSWSFRQDGGYDCSISVISKGEILEALTVRTGFTPEKLKEDEDSEKDFLNSNLLTQFLKVISSTNV